MLQSNWNDTEDGFSQFTLTDTKLKMNFQSFVARHHPLDDRELELVKRLTKDNVN